MSEDRLLTVAQAAAQLGVTRASLDAAVRDGRLKAEEVLGKRGIRESVLAAYEPRSYGDRAGAKPKGRPRRKA